MLHSLIKKMLAKCLLSYCGRLKMDINSVTFIERRNLFILLLNLGWFMTALFNSMWQMMSPSVRCLKQDWQLLGLLLKPAAEQEGSLHRNHHVVRVPSCMNKS